MDKISNKSSPRITHLSWGRIEIKGYDKPFKDAKVYPGKAREWDWNETGTRHEPGIQAADVHELLDNGANVIVLTKGFYERLQVCPETLQLLKIKKIQVYILQTEKAVELFNELSKTKLVGGLFHSTC